ncbi:GTP-binding protein [Lichenihabitans sp. PAMC28606]|uniref:CobW family GTP-binding protein n=1 Tax=Lichenihabitans sp. PAMC28606 TaxID=2880932 RepID=UPI001D09E361|nr:GTP-binding protein [Lichenihabitans sp. PAMC28606]UDL94761.1 GTP-binding protein [Lichenihabitans sp. PAMC28606]
MTGRVGPWPIAVVTGMLGSGKTTMIGRLLQHSAMGDTLVLVNEFGAVGLDHDLLKAVTDNVVLLPNGCLCCTIRDDIVQCLREIRRGWLAGTIPDFGRVLIETTGLAEPAPLIAALTSHPLLMDSFALQSIVTVVDGEFASQQIDHQATCRNQVVLADRLMVSKTDLIHGSTFASLARRLGRLNALASIGISHDAHPDDLFERAVAPFRHRPLLCDTPDDHLAAITTVLLKPHRPLAWTPFKIWLARLIETEAPHLLRLKGRLAFDGAATRVILQAVHHTFYPVIEDPTGVAQDAQDFLVLIFSGPSPLGFNQSCGKEGFTLFP